MPAPYHELGQMPVDEFFVKPHEEQQAGMLEDDYSLEHFDEDLEKLRGKFIGVIGMGAEDLEDQGCGLVGDAIVMSMRLGRQLVDRIDRSGVAGKLLETTNPQAIPKYAYLRPSAEVVSAAGEFDSTDGGHLKVSDAVLDRNFTKNFISDELAAELKRPEDLALIMFVYVAAHESGHAMLSGISQHIESESPAASSFAASFEYLSKRPELAVSGALEADLFVQEERFAEGFGQLVACEAIYSLGYEGEVAKNLFNNVVQSLRVDEAPGNNQLDYLQDGASMVPPSVRANNGKEAEYGKLAELGYVLSMDAEQLVSELRDLAELVENGPSEVGPIDVVDWAGKVASVRQDKSIKQALDYMKADRTKYLKAPGREKRARHLVRAKKWGQGAVLATAAVLHGSTVMPSDVRHDDAEVLHVQPGQYELPESYTVPGADGEPIIFEPRK